ncbi:transmembrane protein 79-like [Argopecten irradians]|uniref:transmembrane protein 79-like n=1 Tax=Argopecten irradians TaxID=31199 RepID=UPI00371B243E
MAPSDWTAKRSSDFYFRLTTAAGLTTIYFFLGYRFFPFQLPVLDTVLDRLVFTLRWQVCGAFVIIMALHWVINIREKNDCAANPLDKRGVEITQLARNILQNTIEQYLFHFVAQMVLCTYLTSETMKVIPLLVVLFVVARVVFKVCYEIDPMMRVYGFSTTFLPTVVTWVYCLYCFVFYGAGFGLGN